MEEKPTKEKGLINKNFNEELFNEYRDEISYFYDDLKEKEVQREVRSEDMEIAFYCAAVSLAGEFIEEKSGFDEECKRNNIQSLLSFMYNGMEDYKLWVKVQGKHD